MAGNERFNVDVVLNDRDFQSGLRRMVSGMQSATRETRGLGTAASGMGTSFTNAFKAAAGIGAVLGGLEAVKKAFAGVVSTGMEYTKQMSKVESLSGASAIQMAELGANARKLGADTVWSATNVAEAYEFMATAGWDANAMIAASKPLLDLATAGSLDLAKASSIVTDTMTPFGMKADEAGRAADVYAVASARANLNVEQLGETMKYAAPVAATFGMSIEDTAVIAEQFANAGIKASMAGTALRAGLSRLAEPPKAAAKAMEELGISTVKADGTMKDMRTIISEMSPKFNQLANQQQIAAAKAIFGEEAYAGWIQVLKNGTPEWDRLHADLDNSKGAAEQFAKVMSNNMTGAVDNFKSQAENLGLVLFSQVETALVSVTNAGNGYVESLTKMIDPTGRAVEAQKYLNMEGMKHAQNLALLEEKRKQGKISAEEYTNQLAAENQRTQEATTYNGLLAQKQKELQAQLQAGVITQQQYDEQMKKSSDEMMMLAAGIDQQKSRQEALNQTFAKIKDIMMTVWEVVKPIWDDMQKFIGEQMQKIKDFVDKYGEDIKVVWDALWKVISFVLVPIWEGIKNIISGALDIIMGIIVTVSAILQGDWGKLWDGIKMIIEGAWKAIIGFLEVGVLRGLGTVFGKIGKVIVDTISKPFKWMKDALGRWWGGMGDDAVRGGASFVDSMKRGISAVVDIFKHPFDSIERWLRGINWYSIGRAIVQTLIDGLKAMVSPLTSAVRWIGEKMNPLSGRQAPDTPIGHISGGQLTSPAGIEGLRLSSMSEGGLALLSPMMTSGLAQALSGATAGVLNLGVAQSAVRSRASGNQSGSTNGLQVQNGAPTSFYFELPVKLNDREIAKASGRVMRDELRTIDKGNALAYGGGNRWS